MGTSSQSIRINQSIQIKWKSKVKLNKVNLLWRRICLSFQNRLSWHSFWRYSSESDIKKMFHLNWFLISHSLVFRFVQEITQQQFYEAFSLYIETQNCRRVQVGKGLWRSCDPTLLLKQGHMLARLVDRKDWALYSLWSDSCLKEKKLTLNLFCNVNENLISRCLIQINPWKNFHYIPREWVQIPGKIWGIWA